MTMQRYICSTRITYAEPPSLEKVEHYKQIIAASKLSADVDEQKYPVYLLDPLDAKSQFVNIDGEIGVIFDGRLLDQIALLQYALYTDIGNEDRCFFGFLRILKEQALLTGKLEAIVDVNAISGVSLPVLTHTTPDGGGYDTQKLQEYFIISHLLAHARANEANDFSDAIRESGRTTLLTGQVPYSSKWYDENQVVSWFGEHGSYDDDEYLENEPIDSYFYFRRENYDEIVLGAGFDQFALNCLLKYCEENNIPRYLAYASGFLVLRCIHKR